jgi:diguanylate cyclase (GGDEF)-like protein
LLDIVMPEMDGYQLCQRLKADETTSSIPVIFLSSRDATIDKTKGFNAGAVDYVTKPMQIEELEARIQTHIRLKEQSQYLESMAFFDPLTRVANRRKYNEVLQREWTRCIRYHHQMSMILIDIDYFKEYNEAYGHAEGDNCLIAVARALENLSNRPADIFARVGGEEFVLLLPDCNTTGAVQKAEAILEAVRLEKIEHKLSPLNKPLSVSLGVATMYPSQGHSALALFQAADDAMFTAKRNGRDQLHIAQLENIPGLSGEKARQAH